ncbi:hypothetical protein AFE_0541 [Acidithiobacillus ferrooxidans ATCC 23270]|uniref:Uncharacterized protein n=1 Tax=Acidithiobacillus ferrooxidans (strain ATCC 23270 / DSM 14882 / CIP 104768 / NCIMB 8455) TaxID=243159 RepID=B7J560_ACIF2|nr:hypothetical protein AFE_0541 [Acidithiobacillus ferrooxidans ATCC 23270]
MSSKKSCLVGNHGLDATCAADAAVASALRNPFGIGASLHIRLR